MAVQAMQDVAQVRQRAPWRALLSAAPEMPHVIQAKALRACALRGS